MAWHEKAAAVWVEERLLVAALLQRRLVLHLNKLPSAGNGRRRGTAPMVTRAGINSVTRMRAEVRAMAWHEKAAAVWVEERLLVAALQCALKCIISPNPEMHMQKMLQVFKACSWVTLALSE